ncbi:bifunctional folylpolyglutamate synthase/dihydrofolate synthase [Neoactinobaculum massilliense]|uniref:bifunctional folylpolyglutamate synthase/dihydrofolate synthase n=1 Tax=Neoactinobaculum massilliense TaxID=2364794 RepID=UPI001F153807|nr:folylpolyglutamate synthase/dihydrofolate synthase family protein [Neoactinobaculum massilliense]
MSNNAFGIPEESQPEQATPGQQRRAYPRDPERDFLPDPNMQLTPDPEMDTSDDDGIDEFGIDAQGRTAAEREEDERFDRALKDAIRSPLFAGPDPTVIEDVINAPAPEPIDELADRAELDAKVEAIYQNILSRAPEHKVQPSLERVRRVLDIMGNPQLMFHAIHITGTNGKTSTARMIESLLRERGVKTGRFTSPHLESVRERIAINGQSISRADFISTWEDVAPFIEKVDRESQAAGGPRLSFFEVFVVMAYWAFANAPIDVAVIEVGMGGRWDATNVIDGEVAVLTPVDLDHQQWLGNTVEEIAREKVGIIKPGASVVSARQKESVEHIILERAHEVGASVVFYGEDMRVISHETAVGGQLVSIQTPAARYEDVPLGLKGVYQGENATLALTAVEQFFGGASWPGDIVEHGLMAATSPGRMEVVRSSPTVLVDAAHNPHGARATAAALAEYYPGNRVGVMAMMADKDVEGTLGELEPVLDQVVITGMPWTSRAMDMEDLAEVARGVFGEDRVRTEADLLSAIDTAAGLAEAGERNESMTEPIVVVTGSIQLVGEARRVMGKHAPDGAE